jgi:tetratricopeptide (TPR) repeat protein
MDQLVLINVRALWRRFLLLVPVALAITGAWHALRWYIGNTMAEFATDLETARVAARLAPDDPQSHYTLAVQTRKSFLPGEMAEALRQCEQAASLSPNDYRLWMDLGRMREQAGDAEGGARALRRATELAPHYAMPRWYLGNLLLRQGQYDEAFAELRRAGDADPTLRPQVFNLAWRIYGENVQAVTAAVGDSAPARAQLAEYLVNQKRVDDSIRLWSSLSPDEKREQAATGERLMRVLFGAKRFRLVLQVYRDYSGATDVSLANLLNGGFEDEVGAPGASLFGWQVVQVPQTQIRIDPYVHAGGRRSLRIIFNAPSALEFRNVSQFIVVEPNARYQLEYWARTEDLKSASTLVTEVVDAADPSRVLGASAPLPTGTNDWQPVKVEFTTPAQTEGITVRLNRAQCMATVCPIFGKVWYDDFDLKRVSADAHARSGGSSAGNLAGADGGR